MKSIKLILLIFFTKICYCQDYNEANWRRDNVKIAVLKEHLLKEKIIINDISYNYSRLYPDTKFTEYGNVTDDLKANGQWLYINNKGAMFLSGNSQNGLKTGSWKLTLGKKLDYHKLLIYDWLPDSSSTYLLRTKNSDHK